jgi:hypothetical protein
VGIGQSCRRKHALDKGSWRLGRWAAAANPLLLTALLLLTLVLLKLMLPARNSLLGRSRLLQSQVLLLRLGRPAGCAAAEGVGRAPRHGALLRA